MPETSTVVSACTPARASEVLAPRVDVLNQVGEGPHMAGPRVVQTAELFDRFNTLCGRCHVSTANGGRQLSARTFPMNFDTTWLASIKSDNPAKAMPPENRAFSSRSDSDPVKQLVALLEPWMEQGRPLDMFVYDVSGDPGNAGNSGSVGSYAYRTMTNLGDCIPARGQVAQSPSGEMESMDEFFAGATELPSTLDQTDLTTFDAEQLAANGVIGYVPSYPLWSDGSGKLRHIRVPKGTRVTFDKQKQSFSIPPNTRFYKTFFRKVVDGAGHETARKIETRLILARPDTVGPDGQPQSTALFGTYIWSEDESTASLHAVPYRDGTPFADRTMTYIANEIEYHDVMQSLPPGSGATLPERLKAALAKRPGVVRHYAVPGSIRCVQCHEGSPSHDFVLGFFPLQIAQRPGDTGGKYEPVGADEVTQLQRLIDYGVISGMTSPADVVPLEDSQLPRKARTPGELAAQAYMLGNCAHCHNPDGFPSRVKPELSAALNFMPTPGQDGGGVFEFPFDRMSPVRSRGANQDVPIPYITPSLRDYPVANVDNYRLDTGAYLGFGENPPQGVVGEVTWSPKYDWSIEAGSGQCSPTTTSPYCGKRTTGRSFVAAPWRSLIYRNVDAPFPYFDDYVPFPHMPMNSAGFDCRAPRIMGDWMVGLPALHSGPTITENKIPRDSNDAADKQPQPYVEVKPDHPNYAMAVAATQDRLKEYHEGVRYQYCQDVLGPDILDPVATSAELANNGAIDQSSGNYHPDPARYIPGGIPPTAPGGSTYVQPPLGVPYHSHWFDYDPTDAPPPWVPRRGPIWRDILIDGVPDEAVPAGPRVDQSHLTSLTDAEIAERALVGDTLRDSSLTEALRTFALTDLPFGLWQEKPECKTKLASAKTVADFTAGGKSHPAWMDIKDRTGKTPPADGHVFMTAPGEVLYRHICFNCHGPRADGKGLQGDALAASSEGQARPANFMSGLFGPLENRGQNLLDTFAGDQGNLATATQWGARYMAWMALGGTLQYIPKDVIHQVEATRVLGQARVNTNKLGVVAASANMLNLAKGLCGFALPDLSHRADGPVISNDKVDFIMGRRPDTGYPFVKATDIPFIHTNGDWDLWMRLCNQFSDPVVRVYSVLPNAAVSDSYDVRLSAIYYAKSAAPFASYPADAPVLDHDRVVRAGVQPENYFAACLEEPTDTSAAVQSVLTTFASAGTNMPFCPKTFLAKGRVLMRTAPPISEEDTINAQRWALRGAIAAGMSVFAYLQTNDLVRTKGRPYYNECQLLP